MFTNSKTFSEVAKMESQDIPFVALCDAIKSGRHAGNSVFLHENLSIQQIRDLTSALNQNPSITTLDLASCDIDTDKVGVLADLIHILKLSLRNNKKIREGSITLLRNSTIVDLDLHHTGITMETIKGLLQRKTLKSLDIGENGILYQNTFCDEINHHPIQPNLLFLGLDREYDASPLDNIQRRVEENKRRHENLEIAWQQATQAVLSCANISNNSKQHHSSSNLLNQVATLANSSIQLDDQIINKNIGSARDDSALHELLRDASTDNTNNIAQVTTSSNNSVSASNQTINATLESAWRESTVDASHDELIKSSSNVAAGNNTDESILDEETIHTEENQANLTKESSKSEMSNILQLGMFPSTSTSSSSSSSSSLAKVEEARRRDEQMRYFRALSMRAKL